MKAGHCACYVIATFIFATSVVTASDSVTASSSEDQIGVEVTVYNNNLGLVKDTRKIGLPKGVGEILQDQVPHLLGLEVVISRLGPAL